MNAVVKIWITAGIVAGALAWPRVSPAFEALTDTQMDQITAGAAAVTPEENLLRFELGGVSATGRRVDVSGSLAARRREGDSYNNLGTLVLEGSAQANLRSLININAVNSPVQVLLNLNININSAVGNLQQVNVSGLLP